MSESFLPYGKHSVDENDIAAVAAILRGDWLTTGPHVQAFEGAFADAVGARFAVACSSGTAAIHLAALALGLGKGDQVVVPTLTFLASANGPHLAGAEIIFADVDPDTALLSPENLRASLQGSGGRVRAVIAVHMNGQACDMPALSKVAADHGATIIEDACHALATTYRTDVGWSKVGSCANSAMACFSFHPVKTIAMGEGGAVTTNDPGLYERLCRLRNHGMSRDIARFVRRDQALDFDGNAHPWYYEMLEPSLNYRASDINCALGLSQLQKLSAFAKRRQMLADVYDARFVSCADLARPVPRMDYCNAVLHLYVILIEWRRLTKSDRTLVMRELAKRGIGTQVHYLPVHRQPYYWHRYGPQKLPGADEYYRRAMSIPLYPAMSEADVDRVVETLADVLRPAVT